MNENEYGELLRYARTVVRENGRSDFDEQAFRSRLRDVGGPADAVVAYLSALRDEFSLGSERTVRTAMRRFRGVQTESGKSVSGIRLDVNEEDSAALGTQSIRLAGSADLDEVVVELDNLIRDVESDRRDR